MANGTPPARGPNGNPLISEVTDKITVPVLDKAGAEVGSVEVDPAEFGGTINRQLMHDVVLMYRANQRAGTHSTLRRGEVAGSTKKVFRQKGTGNARVGTKRTNKRRGGGTAKGPKPRDYYYSLPKQAVRAATRMAILSKLRDGEVVVFDDLAFDVPKTKEMVGRLKTVKVGAKTNKDGREDELSLADVTLLIGTAVTDMNVYKSARNLAGVQILPTNEFNCYAVLRPKRLVLTRAALETLMQSKPGRRPGRKSDEPASVAG